MIVCVCRAVSEQEVDQVVAAGATSVEAISASTGACTDCGACHRDLERRVAQAAGRHLATDGRSAASRRSSP